MNGFIKYRAKNIISMLGEKKIPRICIVFLFALLPVCYVYSQNPDSTVKNLSKKNSRFLQFFRNAFIRKNDDSFLQPGPLVIQNDAPFLPYQGKTIRHILVKKFGFDKTFADTTKEISYFGKDFIKHLHRYTKEEVIRHNLFIKENTFLNPNVVADNERHLRSLNYIYDARILVSPVANSDSVDLIVITKDFLSIIFELNDVSSARFKSKIGDANLMGAGQKVQFTTLLEKKRDPHFGYEILYRKNSIGKSFINAGFGYSTIYPDLNDRSVDEHTWHVEIERPLVSQYLHVAGGVTFAHSQTENNYLKPDSLFYNYRSDVIDAWIGYNLGIRKFLFLKSVRTRQFISVRYFQNKFSRVPYQVNDEFNFRFNEREAILAQFSFFRQTFYKTNYVLGFGITEDVPYGYNIALTTGWYRQVQMERLYVGVDANKYIVSLNGQMTQYFLRMGGFLNKGKIQDAAVLLGASAFSKIFAWKNLKIRQYLRISYTKQFKRIGLDPLGINNIFGLPYISVDSASGNQRSSLHTETIFFPKFRLLGFRFAPFASGDLAYFTPEQKSSLNAGFYFGLGGGLRMRNENILFGTIEMRFMYFPRKSQQHNSFKFTVVTNLRFRSSFNYVKAPDIIQVNSDPGNNIY